MCMALDSARVVHCGGIGSYDGGRVSSPRPVRVVEGLLFGGFVGRKNICLFPQK
jgi:hypothetical protein